MELKEKTRSEVAEKDKWDLTETYCDLQNWEKDYDTLQSLYPKIEAFKGKIMESPKSLLECLSLYYQIDNLGAKLYVYARANSDTDLGNAKYTHMVEKVLNLFDAINQSSSFVIPEILQSNLDQVEEYIKKEPSLKTYHTLLCRIFKDKEHTLSDDDEKLLSSFRNIVSNFEKGSSFIRDMELDFGFIEDENGKKIKLNASNCFKYSISKDRNVRKQVYENRGKSYDSSIRSLACNYIGHIKYDELEAKLRKYPSALDYDFIDLNIDRSVYENLKKCAHQNINIYQKYLKMIKNVLQVETLEPYDLSAPLVSEVDHEYSFEEAKEIILDIFSIYGEDYINVLKQIFEKRWIDVEPSKNKMTGWYAWGVYGCHPIVFANYHSKIFDISALSHELGHAVNFYKIFASQPVHYSDNTLFTAEVASLTNEIVFSHQMLLKTEDKNEKLQILDNLIGLFSNNFFGTVKGAEFEEKTHDLVRSGDAITFENLNHIWEDLFQKYSGDIVSSSFSNGWARVSHFYTSFYYYKYATGVSAACSIAKKILTGDQNAVQNYLSFLEIGNSVDSLDAIQVAGVDMKDPSVYEDAIQMYDGWLDEFMKIYNS